MSNFNAWTKRAVAASQKKKAVQLETQALKEKKARVENEIVQVRKNRVGKRRDERRRVVENAILRDPSFNFSQMVRSSNRSKLDPACARKLTNQETGKHTKSAPKDVWARVFDYELVKLAEEKERKKKKGEARGIALRDTLGKQIQEQREKERRRLQDEKHYAEQVIEQVEKAKQVETAEKEREAKKYMVCWSCNCLKNMFPFPIIVYSSGTLRRHTFPVYCTRLGVEGNATSTAS
jgi:hypothetical protein